MKINLIFQNQIYPVDIDLFNMQFKSLFEEEINSGVKEINYQLVTEFESNIKIKEETIAKIIEYYTTGEIEIENEDAFCIKFLSNKFRAPILLEKAKKYINSNYEELVEDILDKIGQKNYPNSEEEKFLSSHIIEYIDDDRLHDIPIHSLHRIFKEYSTRKRDCKSSKTNRKSDNDDNEDKDEKQKQVHDLHQEKQNQRQNERQ